MAFHFEGSYPTDVKNAMRNDFNTLSEKDRRRYAAVEADRLGPGYKANAVRGFSCKNHNDSAMMTL